MTIRLGIYSLSMTKKNHRKWNYEKLFTVQILYCLAVSFYKKYVLFLCQQGREESIKKIKIIHIKDLFGFSVLYSPKTSVKLNLEESS